MIFFKETVFEHFIFSNIYWTFFSFEQTFFQHSIVDQSSRSKLKMHHWLQLPTKRAQGGGGLWRGGIMATLIFSLNAAHIREAKCWEKMQFFEDFLPILEIFTNLKRHFTKFFTPPSSNSLLPMYDLLAKTGMH